jgi:hypothetical protein
MLNELKGAAHLPGDIRARNAGADYAIVVAPLRNGVVRAFARQLDPAVVGHLLECAVERLASNQIGVCDGALRIGA